MSEVKMKAFLSGSGITSNRTQFTVEALTELADQLNARPFPIVQGFESDKKIGECARALIEDGRLYAEGTIEDGLGRHGRGLSFSDI